MRQPLNGAEADQLTHACQKPTERLIVTLLLDTGVRLREASQLTEDAVDWQAERFTVRGKRGVRRVVPMSPRVRELLERWLAVHDRLPAARTIEKIVRRVAKRAHLRKPVTPHVLRHTFAVLALQRGLSLPALQRLLGHAHLTSTAVYLNLAPEDAVREYRERVGKGVA